MTIDEFRKRSLDRVALTCRALKCGLIPLDILLDILAGEVFQDAGKHPSRGTLERSDLEYLEGFRALLGNAKRAILENTLVVRQLTTGAPINAEPGIQAWCDEEDHPLKSIDEMRPHGRIAVKIEDARVWLTDMGIPAPEWLHGDARAMEEETQAPEPRSRAQEHLILGIVRKLGLDPQNLPRNKPGRPEVKTEIRKTATREKSIFLSAKTFDTAWERLSKDGSIAYEKTLP
jgi:hypothetical protein